MRGGEGGDEAGRREGGGVGGRHADADADADAVGRHDVELAQVGHRHADRLVKVGRNVAQRRSFHVCVMQMSCWPQVRSGQAIMQMMSLASEKNEIDWSIRVCCCPQKKMSTVITVFFSNYL